VKEGLGIGDLEIHWLNGGTFELDGGTMFGAVPRVLWSKRFPYDEENFIRLPNLPLLVKTPDALVVIDAGLGNKLTDRQKKIYRVREPWDIPGDLGLLGFGREDITHVILTHCDFDHAGGVVMNDADGSPTLTFPNARHVVQGAEWEDVKLPGKRAAHSYWTQNFAGLEESGRLSLVDGEREVVKGIKVVLAGGHTRGHQVVSMESGGNVALHMGDLLPTHAHFNPLWISAYDNFPLDAVDRKEELEGEYVGRGAWFTFYHDPFMRACRFDGEGNVLEKWVTP
jgi:glyoxylase-like metal-dependent hydrolase (beta-lactamase superfamily II)